MCLELLILLTQPPECWECRCAPLCLAFLDSFTLEHLLTLLVFCLLTNFLALAPSQAGVGAALHFQGFCNMLCSPFCTVNFASPSLMLCQGFVPFFGGSNDGDTSFCLQP
jgi:hypothetical protein